MQSSEMSLGMIYQAQKVIRGVADHTPFIPATRLRTPSGAPLFLKLETTQPIGAFKLRGACNALAHLPDGAAGVTCCSTGNHGRGVAYSAAKRGMRAVICMSHLVPQAKVEGIRRLGAEVRIIGRSQDEAEAHARALVREEGLIEISPFDDPHVIAGQGTVGVEMLAAQPDLASLIIPLSGGGLAAGIALAAKSINPAIRIIGVTMERGAAMEASLRAGRPVEVEEFASLADSLGGGIGQNNRLSFPLCQRYIDEVVLVSETEIYHAMQYFFYEERMVAEGGSVVGLAALLSGKLDHLPDGPAATVITGRNLDMALFGRIIAGQDVSLGDLTIKGAVYDG